MNILKLLFEIYLFFNTIVSSGQKWKGIPSLFNFKFIYLLFREIKIATIISQTYTHNKIYISIKER